MLEIFFYFPENYSRGYKSTNNEILAIGINGLKIIVVN